MSEPPRASWLTFAGIVSEHPINYDTKLTVCEPAVGPEPSLCLDGGSRHEKKGSKTNQQCYQSFQQEEPPDVLSGAQ
jgi:hypothetical protein